MLKALRARWKAHKDRQEGELRLRTGRCPVCNHEDPGCRICYGNLNPDLRDQWRGRWERSMGKRKKS